MLTKSTLRRKGFISAYTVHHPGRPGQELKVGQGGRSWSRGQEEHCLLACSRLLLSCGPGPPTLGQHRPRPWWAGPSYSLYMKKTPLGKFLTWVPLFLSWQPSLTLQMLCPGSQPYSNGRGTRKGKKVFLVPRQDKVWVQQALPAFHGLFGPTQVI